MEASAGVDFLKRKYDLHNSPEVDQATKRTEFRTGEKISQDPASRIENYLNRFEELSNRKDTKDRERGLDALKEVLHRKYIVKPNEIPEAYFKLQVQILRDRGQGGDWESLSENQKQTVLKQGTEAVISDQEGSLDNWINYFASNDAPYPTWLKYYATRSVVGLSSYDKEKKIFPQRSKGTTKPFPELNREALAYVFNALEDKYTKNKIDLTSFEENDREQFQNLLNGENFAKLYSWAIEKVTPASHDRLLITDGKWIKYNKGTEPTALVTSLQGHGTGWCTAGESTARTQLQGGDFYVYYSLDQYGKPTTPRIAIRMEDDQIGEVRGIAEDQNLDPYIGKVVQKKLEEFPDGKLYEKKVNDMKILTDIDRNMNQGQGLTKEELIFLYEINGKIEGFGYQRDPRIAEIRTKRNSKEDAPIVLDCTTDEIAWSRNEINKNTKAYIGPLFPDIFNSFGTLENIYTTFPEGRIRRDTIGVGGKSADELERTLKQNGINVGGYTQQIMEKPEFVTLKSRELVDLIHLKVADLGFTDYPTTDQIYETARRFGLELCPPEVGPELRLKYADQPLNEWKYIAMKQITGSYGRPHVFRLVRHTGGLWLYTSWAVPTDKWNLDAKFVFRHRKLKS